MAGSENITQLRFETAKLVSGYNYLVAGAIDDS